MADISIDYKKVGSSVGDIKSSYKKMYEYSDDINKVGKQLKGLIDASVISSLNTVTNENKDIAKNLEQLKESLEEILKEYKDTEKRITNLEINREKISDPAKTDTTVEAIGDYILDALWQAIAGDFTDENNALGILLSVLVGIIPYVGQVCDIRDLIADIIHLVDDGPQTEEWVDLGFTLIAFIPGIGDFLKKGDDVAKDISKVLKGADNVDEIADAVKGVMKKGDKVYSSVEKAVKDVIDSKKLTKAINDAAKKISDRTSDLVSKGIDRIVSGKEINETVQKVLKGIGEYGDNLIDNIVTDFEKNKINETIEDIKSAIGTGQVSDSESVVLAY